MVTVRKADTRGHGCFGWLEARYTFSFGHYYDPANMGFSALRALNEARVVAGEGFPTTAQRAVEIVTYMIEGVLEHRDSLGCPGRLRAGDVQRLHAGRGISSCERNGSHVEGVHYVELWLGPTPQDGCPTRQQRHFTPADKRARLALIAGGDDRRDGRDDVLPLAQDVAIYAALLEPGDEVIHRSRS